MRCMKPALAAFGLMISFGSKEFNVLWLIQLMFRRPIKNEHGKRDPSDSRKLARSLRNGDLKGIYVPIRPKLEDRSLVRTRAEYG